MGLGTGFGESTAETEVEKERALKWICFLPQALLRVPRRGGKAGKGAVNKRFSAIAKGDWGLLVSLWESDVKIAKEKEERRQVFQIGVDSEEAKQERLKRNVLRLVSTGQVSKAMSRLTSHGVARMSDPVIKQQM